MSYQPANFGGHSHPFSGVIMILVCHVISLNHVIMVGYHPDKFGGNRHCGSEDIMLLVGEGEDPRCSCFNPPLLFISKVQGLKAHGLSY